MGFYLMDKHRRVTRHMKSKAMKVYGTVTFLKSDIRHKNPHPTQVESPTTIAFAMCNYFSHINQLVQYGP